VSGRLWRLKRAYRFRFRKRRRKVDEEDGKEASSQSEVAGIRIN